jgi:predicted PurR-regulated permease PerM
MPPIPPPTEYQARLIWLALSGLALAVLGALFAGLIWALGHLLQILGPVLWPIALAGVLACLLDPVVDRLQKLGLKRSRAILMVFLLGLLIVAAVFGSIVPQLVNEAERLVARVPAYVARIEQRLTYWVSHPPPMVRKLVEREQARTESPPAEANATPDLTTNTVASPPTGTNNPSLLSGSINRETLQTATEWLASALPRLGSWLFGQVGRVASWIGIFVGLALVPVYAFYFLLEKQSISSRWTDYLPVSDSHFKQELVFVLNSINNYLVAFFRGQVLVATCDGFLYGLGFLLVGIDYAVLIGAAAMVLTMIPFVGAIVTCSTALIIALVQHGDWLHPVLVLAVFACVQALEGLIISPKIMGGRVGLHPVTIIIAVMAGTTLLGGLLGGILAIPLTAALRVLMFRYVWKRPAERLITPATAPA